MTETYGPVVAGVSLVRPELNGPVIEWAADEAAARALPLRIVHAQEWPRGTSPDAAPDHPAHVWSRHHRAAGEGLLEEVRAAAAARRPAVAVATELVAGRAVQALRDAAEKAALLVIGARRLTGVEGAFAGRGKAHALVGHLPCPAVLVPEPVLGVSRTAPVVVGVDGSPSAMAAVDLAFAEADAAGADLVAVSVRRPHAYGWVEYREDVQLRLSEQLAGYRQRFPDMVVRHEILTGDPAVELAAAARFARCLVVGCRGRGGFKGLVLGSTSRALVHHTYCPLVVTPAQRED